MTVRLEFTAELWHWEAHVDSWVFVRLPVDVSEEIRSVPRLRAGFGSVKVRVTLGGSHWSTSVFSDAASGTYVLRGAREEGGAGGRGRGRRRR